MWFAKHETTSSKKNYKLLTVIQKKGWDLVRVSFLEILRITNNDHCADKIQGISPQTSQTSTLFTKPSISADTYSSKVKILQNAFDKPPTLQKLPQLSTLLGTALAPPKILKRKWWPDKKILISSLHHRKIGSKLLVTELHDRILNDSRQMVVIRESATAVKYSGMGGVGKTLTAKWYAHHHEAYYDHILWIDCEGDSMLKSFKNLARDLDVKHLDQLSGAEEFATKSFEVLSDFKCLWIYDNAESYRGDEGVIKVLPKYEDNFYCLITSRSTEWGVADVGYGKISDLQLDIFSDEESVEFLKATLNNEINYTESQLKKLCNLLGNLPLALQLAVSALKCGKINLQDYIEQTSAKDIESIVDAEFDDYEKKINKNIGISLDLIKKEKNGKWAIDILMLFGYITPDNVQSKFLFSILNCEFAIFEEAIELLKKYCLLSKTGTSFDYPYDIILNGRLARSQRIPRMNFFRWLRKLIHHYLGLETKIKTQQRIQMDLLSIHRLLQQVIRYNGRKTEMGTLRKLLSCKGFLEYKIIPFTKYANKQLQREFSDVKVQLLNQAQLQKLVREEKYDEAVRLAKFIYEESQTNATKFNICVCLHKNEQLEECVSILEQLIEKRKPKNTEISKTAAFIKPNEFQISNFERDQELCDVNREPTKPEIGSFLYYLYKRLRKVDEALSIINAAGKIDEVFLMMGQRFVENNFEESCQLATFVDEELKSNTSKFNRAICLDKNGQLSESITALETIQVNNCNKKFNYSIYSGLLYLNENLSKSLLSGYLLLGYWRTGNKKGAREILKKNRHLQFLDNLCLNKLIQIMNSDLMNYYLYYIIQHHGVLTAQIELQENKGNTSRINVRNCSLDLSGFDRFTAEEVTLENISFTRNGLHVQNIKVNDIIDLKRIKRLEISYNQSKNNSIELLSGDEVKLEYLHLGNVRILDWKECNWKIHTMTAVGIQCEGFTQLQPKQFTMSWSSINISKPVPSIRKLNIKRKRAMSLYKFSAEELIFDNVTFNPNGKFPFSTVNEILDLQKINRLTLGDYKESLCLDMSERIFIDYLELRNIKVLDWERANWHINKLRLEGMRLDKVTKLQVNGIETDNSFLDISCLPKTVQKLSLGNGTKFADNSGVLLPKLNYLELSNTYSSHLSHFTFTSLPIQFQNIEQADFSLLPDTVTQIKITNLYYHNVRVYKPKNKLHKIQGCILSFHPSTEQNIQNWKV